MTLHHSDQAHHNCIAVIIVTYQSALTIESCLKRLCQAKAVVEICIVDNESTDQTQAILKRMALKDTRIRVICNEGNPGFAHACNQGANATYATWLAFVNPDVLVEGDTLVRLRNYAADIGPCILGVEQVDEHGVLDPAVRRRDPNFKAMLSAPRRHTELAIPVDPSKILQEVPALSGAFLMFSRDLFVKLGGWDTGYLLHAEDLDLCRRARAVGARVAVVNALRVIHVRGVSSRSRPWFVEWNKHRGLWRYFCKFESQQTGLLVKMGVWLAIWGHAVIKAIGLLFKR